MKVYVCDKQMNGPWSMDVYALFCDYLFDEVCLKNEKNQHLYLQRICAYSIAMGWLCFD